MMPVDELRALHAASGQSVRAFSAALGRPESSVRAWLEGQRPLRPQSPMLRLARQLYTLPPQEVDHDPTD